MSNTGNKRKVNIVPLSTHTGLKLLSVKDKAGGLPAIFASYQHLRDEIGLLDGVKLLSRMNQKGGFDCPGCAWPDPDQKRSALGEYCENGVKAIAEEATKKRITASFFAEHTVEALSAKSDYELGKSGRLTSPMYLPKGKSHYQPISWEDAFSLIGNELKGLNSPHEAVFYTSGRTSNEAAFMYQLFARAFGTNNLPDCSNMCHESSGVGLSETLGIGKGSVTLDDFNHAEVVLVIGQNPGTNHPRMMSALKKCKERGGVIVNVNPLPEAGTSAFIDPQDPIEVIKGGTTLADHFLQVKVNGDVALLKALMWLMWKEEERSPGSVFDLAFIEQHTAYFEVFLEELKQLDIRQAIEQSGVREEKIKTVADVLIKRKKIIVCWAMGITQHKNGVANVREIVNLLLLKGSIGKQGAGTCPVRGHSNVQGDRTMGIYEKPAVTFLTALDQQFDINSPREYGYDVVDAIQAMHASKVKVFIGLGGNFISATPDSQLTGEAMQNCSLSVQISTKLNRSHLVTGAHALILPCISRTEKDEQRSGMQLVSVENSMGVVHASKGMWPPASPELKSEPAIVAGIAKAALTNNSKMNWDEMVENYDVVRNHIEAVIPGFEAYNLRVRQPAGFYLPNGSRINEFNTSSAKALFSVNPLPNVVIEKGRLILTTIRSHDQYNTTIYGLDDRYRGIKNERRVVLMNEEDMKELNLRSKDQVDVVSHFKGSVRKAERFFVVSYNISKGCCAAYFPETNVLVPIDSYAEGSQTPTSKFIEVSIEKRMD
jgi:molybdopterin-dependent oxidoreductase alpha subunit